MQDNTDSSNSVPILREDHAKDEDDSELACGERRVLSDAERRTLAALRFDAETGPLMFADAVDLIERLVLHILRESYDD